VKLRNIFYLNTAQQKLSQLFDIIFGKSKIDHTMVDTRLLNIAKKPLNELKEGTVSKLVVPLNTVLTDSQRKDKHGS